MTKFETESGEQFSSYVTRNREYLRVYRPTGAAPSNRVIYQDLETLELIRSPQQHELDLGYTEI